MLKGKKHTPEQIVGTLRRIEQGETADAVCRDVNMNEVTLCRWKQQYGTLELDELRELKALREKNVRWKQVVAHQALHIQVLKAVNAKNGESVVETLRGLERGGSGLVFAAPGVPLPRAGMFEVGVSGAPADAPTQDQIVIGIVRLSRGHPRYCYRRMHALSLREGLGCVRRTRTRR